MKSLLAPLLRSLGLAALSLLLASQAQAAVSVTGADVTATSSEAVAGTYKTIITGHVLTEAAIGEVKTTTALTLNAPTGWEFDTTGTPPTATVTKAPTGANTANLATVTLGTRAASTITWSVVQSSGNSESIITFGNIRVKSSSGAAHGSMTFSSTPGVTGLTAGSTSLGNFTTTAGAATKLLFGQQPSTVAYGAAISPAVTVRVTDANGFTVTSDTSQITIGSANASLSGTLTANAVAGVATFSNLIPNLAGIGKTLTASHATLTGATSSSFKVSMSLTAATPSWRTLLQGSTYDYINDQQATAVDLELVGNATHPVLYSYYDNNGTDTDTDDTLYLRVRLSGSKSGTAPSTFSSGYLFLGAEVNGDNAMDFFLSITQRTAREQRISVWGVGTGLNVSPNTTSIAAEIPVVDLVTNPTNSNFALVTATNDPSVTDVNLNDATLGTTALALGINDHFLSFKLPFNNTTAAVDSLKEAAAAKGVALTSSGPPPSPTPSTATSTAIKAVPSPPPPSPARALLVAPSASPIPSPPSPAMAPAAPPKSSSPPGPPSPPLPPPTPIATPSAIPSPAAPTPPPSPSTPPPASSPSSPPQQPAPTSSPSRSTTSSASPEQIRMPSASIPRPLPSPCPMAETSPPLRFFL